MNSLPLLPTVIADRATHAVDAPVNREEADSSGAFGFSLAGLLRVSVGGASPVPPIAAGGDGLPGSGKALPPVPADGLPARGLPGMPPGSIADTDRGAGPLADAAAPQEQATLPAPAPGPSDAANPPPFPFLEPTSPSPARVPGTSPAGLGKPGVTAPERTVPAPGQIEVRHDSSVGEGKVRHDALAALSRRVPDELHGLEGEIRHYANRQAGGIRPAPGETRDTRSGPDARYTAPPPAVRPQIDVAIAPAMPEAVEGLDGKPLTGLATGSAALPTQGAAAPVTSAAMPATAPPAPVVPAATVMPAALPAIDVAPGADGWGDALGDRVIMMAGQRVQSADIRLNPADLGPLRVHVAVDDGTVSVSFHAQHALTRDAIEQALPRLRDLLGDNGLALADASVSDQGAPREQAHDSGEPLPYGSASGEDAALAGVAETGPVATRGIAASSLVDLFA